MHVGVYPSEERLSDPPENKTEHLLAFRTSIDLYGRKACSARHTLAKNALLRKLKQMNQVKPKNAKLFART